MLMRCRSGTQRVWWLAISELLCLMPVALTAQTRNAPPSAGLEVQTASQAPVSKSVQQRQPDVRFDLNLANVTLLTAVNEISQKGNVKIGYAEAVLAKAPRVTIRASSITVRNALTRVLQGTLLTIGNYGGQIAIVERTDTGATPATGTLTGRVTDSASNQGIAGVAITVQGTKLTALTDTKGTFTIAAVPAGERTVTVRLLGYTSVTRTLTIEDGKRATLRVMLKEQASMLSGIVTTATGEQRKLEVGNSIVTLNVDSIMQVAPIKSVTDLLENRVPGLTVQRTSGSPGDPARIRLRGASSIHQNNDPILVVDGIRVYSQQSDSRNQNAGSVLNPNTGTGSSYATPSPIDQIDPNMIETVEVLKGPSAAALYGSDAANGVIVVKTKRGQAGPTRWNLALNQGVSSMAGQWPEALWVWGTGNRGGLPIGCLGLCGQAGTADSSKVFQALNDPRFTALGTGSETGVSGSVSGGSQTVQYSFTASGGQTLGMLRLPRAENEQYRKRFGHAAPGWMRRPEQLSQFSATGNVAVQIGRNANIDITNMLSKQSQNRTSMSNSASTAIAELQGLYIDDSQERTTPLLGNPYERVSSDLLTVTSAVGLRYLPVSWLPLTGSFGLSTQTRDDQNLLGRGLITTTTDSTGFLRAGRASATNYTAALYTSARFIDRLSLAAGLNYTRGSTNDFRGSFTDLPIGVTNPAAGLGGATTIFTRATSAQQTFGWFLEPKLNLKSRFFMMPGFRLDNNGLSGKNAKLLSLPKLNFSWIASDEPFFPFGNVIRLFRVRSAFGVAGVQPGRQDGLRLYGRQKVGTQTAEALDAYGEIMPLANLGNTRLRPERGYEAEGGIDAEMWNGRLTLDVTYYNKKRIDAIIDNPVAISVGGGKTRMNIGDILNSGTELAVSAQLIEGRQMGWNMNVSMSRNRSRIVKLGHEYSVLLDQVIAGRSALTYYVAGYPMNAIWERPIYGFADLDGNGFITNDEVSVGSDTLVFMGASDPNYLLSLRSGFTFFGGRLGVHMGFSYVGGLTQRDLLSGTCVYASACPGNRVGSPFILSINNPNLDFGHQAAVAATMGTSNTNSTYGMVRTTNTFRFQSLSINTNLGPRVARMIHAGTVGVAVQGSNLGIWTNYQGKDPNVNAFSTGQGTADAGQLPTPRTWSLRVTVGR